jgi:hypothetical protein
MIASRRSCVGGNTSSHRPLHRGAAILMASGALAILMSAMSSVGCVGRGSVAGAPGEPNQPAINMWLLDADGTAKRYALYKWDSDGAFRFGGGQPALEYETPVRLTFTTEARSTLTAAIKEAGWLEKSFVPADGPGPRELEVDLRLEGTHRKFTILADGRTFDPKTEAVLNVLQTISAQQFGGVLDGLPTADRPAR